MLNTEIPVVIRDNGVAIGQGARPTERPEKATAAARHSVSTNTAQSQGTFHKSESPKYGIFCKIEFKGSCSEYRSQYLYQ